MLIISRKRILECNDFADCLMLIQKKLELNIEKLLSLTKLLRKRDKRLLSSLKGLTSPQNLNPPNNEVDSSNPATRIFRVSQIHVEGDNVSQPLEKHSKNSLSLSSLASTDMLSAESLLTSPSLDERKEIELTSEESETNVSRSSSNKNITASNIDFQEFF